MSTTYTYWTGSGSTGYCQIGTLSGSTITASTVTTYGGQLAVSGGNAVLTVGAGVKLMVNGVQSLSANYIGYVVSGGVTLPVLQRGNGDIYICDLANANSTTLIANVICFLAGTRLEAEAGAVPVERLQPGDRVRTASGLLRAVRWTGQRSIDPTSHPLPAEVLPVRIRAHAMGPGLPSRDLLLSPEHAVLLDGTLVAVRMLCNGGSIRQDDAGGVLDYHHIELDSHDIVLAEGLAAETYLELGNRPGFARFAGQAAADTGQDRGASCAPFQRDPGALEKLWQRLADRSAEIGLPCPERSVTRDPAASIRIGDRDIAPIEVQGDLHRFVVPAGSDRVRLVSRAARPHDIRPFVPDMRRLGVALRGMKVTVGSRTTFWAPSDPCFAAMGGWWPSEGAWRWSSGCADLPIPLPGDDGRQPVAIELDLMPALYHVALQDAAATQP